MTWWDLTGMEAAKRIAQEDNILRIWSSKSSLAHFHRNYGTTAEVTSTMIVGHNHSGARLGPSALWTTWIGHFQQEQQQRQLHPHHHLLQTWLEALHLQQQAAAKPRKTLIMESKACCGIGVSGKILDLGEIQSKQQQARPNAKKINRLTRSNNNTNTVDDMSTSSFLWWDNRPLASWEETIAVEEDNEDTQRSKLFRTQLAWDAPTTA
eukprot:scaffold44630_cov122-Amphora_coffeaeformis.AAC.1